jgi:hypothetical protein
MLHAALLLIACAPTPEAPPPRSRDDNALWARRVWLHEPQDDAAIETLITTLRARGVTRIYPFLGPPDEMGQPGWRDGETLRPVDPSVAATNLSRLAELVDLASQACVWPIPVNYPVFGKDAFRTGTGVHAAAVIKALKKGHDWLADSVYSGVPARWFGRAQQIEIGHMAGDSNILYWLRSRGIEASPALVSAIRDLAKSTNRVEGSSGTALPSTGAEWRPANSPRLLASLARRVLSSAFNSWRWRR